MANYDTGKDLKHAVLKRCGELQDGTSNYDSDALTYLSSVYRAVQTGGNEFGIDVGEPWIWSQSPRPLVFTIQPPYSSGSVTMTLNSNAGSFSVAPSYSVQGWWLKLDARDEWFTVVQHTASSTSFTIDQPYTEASGAINFIVAKLDYDLVDDSIVVDSSNNKLDFQEAASALVATLAPGLYTPAAFAAHVSAQMTAAGGLLTYTHSWDTVRRKFLWHAASSSFSFLFASGTNADLNPSILMCLEQVDYANQTSFYSSFPLNAINRLVAPMRMYRKNPVQFLSPEDSGKIYGIDFNTFVRKFPMTQLRAVVPDRFAVIKESPTGMLTVRLNGYMDQASRVEVPYIPIRQAIQDNDAMLPVMPQGFREYLVHAACYFLMLDKSDNRSDVEAQLAKAKLQALVHHNRKDLSLSGNNYGKLVPRRGGVIRRYTTEVL